MLGPTSILYDPSLLSALRELFGQHLAMMQSRCETLSNALFVLLYLPSRPRTFQVEAALEALLVEGEIFG
jgi:hypothetical protein